MRCLADAQSSREEYVPTVVTLVPRDEGPYEFRCPHGHQNRIALQQMLFELLFEMGLYALRDGYPREAVADFAASLERFYEFFARVASQASGVESPAFEGAWRLVTAQSERQLGLYVGSYLSLFRSVPALLPDFQVKVRNRVLHRGVIPTPQVAAAYGQAVLDLVRPVIRQLRESHSTSINAIVTRHQLAQFAGDASTTQTLSNMSRAMTLSLVEIRAPDGNIIELSVLKALEQLPTAY